MDVDHVWIKFGCLSLDFCLCEHVLGFVSTWDTEIPCRRTPTIVFSFMCRHGILASHIVLLLSIHHSNLCRHGNQIPCRRMPLFMHYKTCVDMRIQSHVVA